MITKAMINRINELYHKSKNDRLTEEERIEQLNLRKEYVKEIRKRVKSQLDNIDIVDTKDGNDR